MINNSNTIEAAGSGGGGGFTPSGTASQLLLGNGTYLSGNITTSPYYYKSVGNGSVAQTPVLGNFNNDVQLASGRVYNVKAYGALGDCKVATDGAITTGTPTLNSASAQFTLSDVGKIIHVGGAGASGAGLRTTILAYVSATQVTLSVNASTTVTGKTLSWGTDDTAAIQASVNAAFAAGGGVVYFPNAIYLIAGALQTSVSGTNPNAQIYIPSQNMTVTTRCAIRFLGESINHANSGYSTLTLNLPTTGVILRSIVAGSGTNPSVIGTIGATGNYQNYNYTDFISETIYIQTYTNSGVSPVSMTGINMAYSGKTKITNTMVGPDVTNNATSNPNGIEIAGIIVGGYNDDGPNIIQESWVSGYKYGFAIGEHTTVNNNYAFCCNYGFAIMTGGYPVSGLNQLVHACNYPIYVAPSTFLGITSIYTRSTINLSIEVEVDQFSYWYDTVVTSSNNYIVVDSNNYLNGILRYHNVSGAGAGALINDKVINTGGLNATIIPSTAPLPYQAHTSGGVITSSSGIQTGTSHNQVLEIGSKISTSVDDYYSCLVQSAIQTGTANVLGVHAVLNSSLGTAEKRMYSLGIVTNGATNNVGVYENGMFAGTLTNYRFVDSNGYRLFGVKVGIGQGAGVNPTALLHLGAGGIAVSASPLKFTLASAAQTTAEVGAMEFSTISAVPILSFVRSGTTREQILTGVVTTGAVSALDNTRYIAITLSNGTTGKIPFVT